MAEEKLRVDYYLHSSSRQPLIAQVHNTHTHTHTHTHTYTYTHTDTHTHTHSPSTYMLLLTTVHGNIDSRSRGHNAF